MQERPSTSTFLSVFIFGVQSDGEFVVLTPSIPALQLQRYPFTTGMHWALGPHLMVLPSSTGHFSSHFFRSNEYVRFFGSLQALQEADDSIEYSPAAHTVQEVDDCPEYLPTAQAVHADDSTPVAAFVNFFPAAHAVQDADDSAEYFPVPQVTQSEEDVPRLGL